MYYTYYLVLVLLASSHHYAPPLPDQVTRLGEFATYEDCKQQEDMANTLTARMPRLQDQDETPAAVCIGVPMADDAGEREQR